MQRRVARTGERPAPTRGRIARTCSPDPSHVDPARSHPGGRHPHVGPPCSHSPPADVHACAGHPAHAAARPDHCCRAARTVRQPARQQDPARCAATANGLATARGRSRINCCAGRTTFQVARTRGQGARTRYHVVRTARRLTRTGTRIGRTDRRRIRTNAGRHCIHFHSLHSVSPLCCHSGSSQSGAPGTAGTRIFTAGARRISTDRISTRTRHSLCSRSAMVGCREAIREDRSAGSRENPCRRCTVQSGRRQRGAP